MSATNGSEPADSSTAESSSSSGSTTYLPVPEGIALTAQGEKLGLGEKATVAWQPRQGVVGVFSITIQRIEKASYQRDFVGWDIKSADRSSQPYFVRAVVRNEGQTELGKRQVPLYIVDQSNLLIGASSFASTFTPCPQGKFFPDSFAPGAVARLCLVYLAPHAGKLSAVSFRPTEDFDPILWTGAVVSTMALSKSKEKGKGKGAGAQTG